MEAKLNGIVNEYAESKINSEETSKRLDAQHVLNIHTLEDKYNKLLKAKVDENNKLTKNLYGLKKAKEDEINDLKFKHDRIYSSEKMLKRRLKVQTEATMEQTQDALNSIVTLQKQLATHNALILQKNDGNKSIPLNQKRAKDPFWFVIPNFLVQVSSPDGHMKNVKWQGHVGEKKSMSLEHFQAIMMENQMNDFDDEEEDDAIDQTDELNEDAKKWFEEMGKQRSDSVLV